VLHVANGRLYGGIERMLVTIARDRVAAPSLESTFAVASPGRLVEDLRDVDAHVTVLGDVRLSRPSSVVAGRSALRRVIRDLRPDVMICHAPWAYALFAGVGRRERLRTVWWQHDRAAGGSIIEGWARTNPADLVISNSRWTSRSARLVQPRALVEVIYCPVALPRPVASARNDIRGALGAAPGHVVLLAASRLEPWKGHLNVLRALHLLVQHPAWILWIAGDAQRPHEAKYRAQLERAVSELRIGPRVRFLGERRDVPALLEAADLLIQANDAPEPFGVVFAEAMLAGRPVITTDMGGAPEIVNHTCGRLVSPGDIRGLADCLSELIADPALRARLGAAGRRHAAALCAPDVVLPRLLRALTAQRTTAAA
jgi:glycosyltransferase involved in cell wall biosynthesis